MQHTYESHHQSSERYSTEFDCRLITSMPSAQLNYSEPETTAELILCGIGNTPTSIMLLSSRIDHVAQDNLEAHV